MQIDRDVGATGALAHRLEGSARRFLADAEKKVLGLGGLLESYSYKGVLERGFVLVRDARGAPVLAADALAPGDGITLNFLDDGVVGATVDSVGGEGRAARTARAKTPAARKKPARKDPGDDPQGSLL